MKNQLRENYKIILSVIGFIFLGPIVINILFKLHLSIEYFKAEWDASAALSYYGAIIAAVIAIYGIFITIQYSQKSYKDDVRNRSMPFIVIDVLRTSSYRTLFSSNNTRSVAEQTEGYREYKLMDYYCILENGEIEYRTGLTKSQQKLLNDGGFRMVSCEGRICAQVVDEVCIPFEIENIGNGAAIRMRYGVNRKGTTEPDRKYLKPLSLKTNTPLMFHIFSENCSEGSVNLGEYVLSFYYEDIYSNKYEQHFDITIEYDQEKHAPAYSVDMSHIQKFLGER